VEGGGFDTGARSGEGRGKDDRVGERKGVGGVGLGGVDVDPVVAGKGRWIEPGAIGEKRVATEAGDGGLEMQTACHRDGDDFVMLGREDGGELSNAFGIAAFGDADEKSATDAENVATFECAGESDVREFTKFREVLCERGSFGGRDAVPSGKTTASSSRTMAGSSTNMESGRSGAAGRERT